MAKGGGPPPIPAPPAPKSKSRGERGVFDSFINSHKALKPYAGQIWTWANNYGGITPTQLAAVLWTESRGNPSAQSGAGALGLAQIFDNSAGAKNAAGVPFFRGDHNISEADKRNPAFAIQYAAWRLSGAVQKYGSIDEAWVKGYNPNYKAGVDGPANPVSRFLPKGYVGTPSQTATQKATASVATTAATASITAQTFDKWAVIDAKGHIGFQPIKDPTKPPKNALLYGGAPLTESGFNQVWKQTYADTFEAYTGRRPKGSEIKQILSDGGSVYALANNLANGKDFQKSPVWKQHAPGLVSYARTILGENWKPSGGIIRKAIAQNWDQATFYANIRKTDAYEKGPEFQDNLAKMKSVAESIYGKADPSGDALIKHVTKEGWTQDEFASWLRSQPAYTQTSEYQSKSVAFLSQLGLITGANATLSGDQIDQMLSAQDRLKLAASTPATGTAPELVSEHGKGGGYTPPGKRAPELVSEHGKGGGYR